MKLTDIKGIGEKRIALLHDLGIDDAEGLIKFFPRTYQDFSRLQTAKTACHSEYACFRLRVSAPSKLAFPKKGMSIVTLQTQDDEGGKVTLVWFNQVYMHNKYPVGSSIYVHGRVDRTMGLRIYSPTVYSKYPGIIPVYPVKHKIPQSSFRAWIKAALSGQAADHKDPIPPEVREYYGLMPYNEALLEIHAPSSMESVEHAQKRFAFEDALYYSIALKLQRTRRKKHESPAIKTKGVLESFISKLPFTLTNGQLSVIDEISRDLSSTRPMNRLLQGDVGSGKTAVAMFAAMCAIESSHQAAFLAPTEILAEQHYKTAQAFFPEEDIALLTGSTPAREKRNIYSRIKEGSVKLVIGTHALMQSPVEFSDLALIICDEQQRFGVRQRAVLEGKGSGVNLLSMSATPIPRTLALTLFGDLDVSTLRDMPHGRSPVKTSVVPQFKRSAMYDYIDSEAQKGHSAYVVCPLIDNDEGLPMESAGAVADELRARMKTRVGLLHGRMKAQEKAEMMDAFREGKIGVLVSTTVIEVGVDVKSATTIVIESAERFGLSQLHQLRGRVGRNDLPGRCFLLASNDMPCERLNILKTTYDGFEIAEHDLRLRGPGQFLGTEQHGESEFIALLTALDEKTLRDAARLSDRVLSTEPSRVDFTELLSAATTRFERMLRDITLS